MKSTSKYYNTIKIEDEDLDPNLQSVRKNYTSSDFDPDLNKNLSEQLIKRFNKEINNKFDWYMPTYYKIKL